MTEPDLTDEQKEALHTIVEKICKIFEDLVQTLRDALKILIAHVAITWRRYQLYIQPDRPMYEWWLLGAARRQLVFAE